MTRRVREEPPCENSHRKRIGTRDRATTPVLASPPIIWTEFFFTLILTSRVAFTLPSIFRSFLGFPGSQYGKSSALTVISLVPSIALGLLVQRHVPVDTASVRRSVSRVSLHKGRLTLPLNPFAVACVDA